MGIVEEDVARVRSQTDIVEVISAHTQLRKVGTRFSGLCPFHTERTPSFSVNAEEGLYYCFGCQKSGDVITFVREMERLDFPGAVEWLANRAGIALRYTQVDEGERRSRRKKLFDAMDAAVDWYHERLVSGADAGAARAYLRSRGFDKDVVSAFKVGWAPDDWDQLARAIGVGRDTLVEAGLGFVNRRNRTQDFFRARIVFPIFDDQGRPVAFGGRKLPDADGPKYRNSPEGPLYDKSSILYGLNWAKADIVAAREAIVCEGYTDVIGFFGAGLPRAVATCGTALTEEHVRTLTRFTNRLVLAYDADEAGRSAAAKVYEWEKRHQIDVAVMALPEGADPDQLAREDPERLVAAVAEAKPMLAFRLQRVLAGADLGTAEGRARAAGAALGVVGTHPDSLVRDQYLMEVADAVRIDVDRLREQLAVEGSSVAHRPNGRPPGRSRRPDGSASRSRHEPPDGADGASEVSAIAGADAEFEALKLVVRGLAPDDQLFAAVLYSHPLIGEALRLLGDAPSAHEAAQSAPPDIAALIARASVDDTIAEHDDVVVRLLERSARRVIRELERDARQSADPLAFAPTIGWLNLQLADLGDESHSADAASEIAGELLAWLETYGGSRL